MNLVCHTERCQKSQDHEEKTTLKNCSRLKLKNDKKCRELSWIGQTSKGHYWEQLM